MSANIFLGAKHDRRKSLVITNKFSAVMLRLCKIGMLPLPINPDIKVTLPRSVNLIALPMRLINT